jgi:hypothetical protein
VLARSPANPAHYQPPLTPVEPSSRRPILPYLGTNHAQAAAIAVQAASGKAGDSPVGQPEHRRATCICD